MKAPCRSPSIDRLSSVLQRCRVDDQEAWEALARWVGRRGRAVLFSMRHLSRADREDVVADTLGGLVGVVRRGAIIGDSDAEIDGYVCAAIRNRALNALRRGLRRRRAGEVGVGTREGYASGYAAVFDVKDDGPLQDARAIADQVLGQSHGMLSSWPPTDRYIFLAKLQRVPARVIQHALAQPPFSTCKSTSAIDTQFHRLRARLVHRCREEVEGKPCQPR